MEILRLNAIKQIYAFCEINEFCEFYAIYALYEFYEFYAINAINEFYALCEFYAFYALYEFCEFYAINASGFCREMIGVGHEREVRRWRSRDEGGGGGASLDRAESQPKPGGI